jgi:hypothetical protein
MRQDWAPASVQGERLNGRAWASKNGSSLGMKGGRESKMQQVSCGAVQRPDSSEESWPERRR